MTRLIYHVVRNEKMLWGKMMGEKNFWSEKPGRKFKNSFYSL